MDTYTNKRQENKRGFQIKQSTTQQFSNNTPFQFADNRPEAKQQGNLIEMMNNSYRVKQLRRMQEMADGYTAQQQHPIQNQENNTGLPDNLKAGIENLSGYSMDDVKVHYNSEKPAQLNAHAYAQGSDIHIASGQEKHLPHEAWHVVQQKQGRVKPTMQMQGGVDVNDDSGLEKEADVMGDRARYIHSTHKAVQRVQRLRESQTLQLRQVIHDGVIFKFDSNGNKVQPKSPGTPTKPEERSWWLNQMIENNLITHPERYISGHQVAHRFGGKDDGDNVAAWPQEQENTYSTHENAIDRGDPGARINEQGKLIVKTIYSEQADLLCGNMVKACMHALRNIFADSNFWKVIQGGTIDSSDSLPSDTLIYEKLYKLFNSQKLFNVTMWYMAQGVKMEYSTYGDANRKVLHENYGIELPTWTNDFEPWYKYLKEGEKLVVEADGRKLQLQLP